MRYVKHFFEDIAGIEIYPMISLLMFFIFFVGLGIYAISMRKSHASYMAARPLDLEDQPTVTSTQP
jgi:cytochrome c oxidase cbb3-type subunit IV